jgi:hypothetical protein
MVSSQVYEFTNSDDTCHSETYRNYYSLCSTMTRIGNQRLWELYGRAVPSFTKLQLAQDTFNVSRVWSNRIAEQRVRMPKSSSSKKAFCRSDEWLDRCDEWRANVRRIRVKSPENQDASLQTGLSPQNSTLAKIVKAGKRSRTESIS